MTTVSGTTSNGFTYEGEYEQSANDSVRWSATYRCNGVYRGMRHGRVFEVSKIPTLDLQVAVMQDIDEVWVKER